MCCIYAMIEFMSFNTSFLTACFLYIVNLMYCLSKHFLQSLFTDVCVVLLIRNQSGMVNRYFFEVLQLCFVLCQCFAIWPWYDVYVCTSFVYLFISPPICPIVKFIVKNIQNNLHFDKHIVIQVLFLLFVGPMQNKGRTGFSEHGHFEK